jgi:F0F1-type ATP synthase assembly protein I
VADDDGLSSLAKLYREAAQWSSAVWQLTGSVMLGTGAGYWADSSLGTKPWGLLAGGLIGCAVGFYAFIRTVLRLMDSKSKRK